VAAHRQFLSKLDRIFFGRETAPPRQVLVRWLFLDIRGFSWLTQTKKGEKFEEKRRAFRMETVSGPRAFFG
jgi:hypothetical protein